MRKILVRIEILAVMKKSNESGLHITISFHGIYLAGFELSVLPLESEVVVAG